VAETEEIYKEMISGNVIFNNFDNFHLISITAGECEKEDVVSED
jgi:hypothetical protein